LKKNGDVKYLYITKHTMEKISVVEKLHVPLICTTLILVQLKCKPEVYIFILSLSLVRPVGLSWIYYDAKIVKC